MIPPRFCCNCELSESEVKLSSARAAALWQSTVNGTMFLFETASRVFYVTPRSEVRAHRHTRRVIRAAILERAGFHQGHEVTPLRNESSNVLIVDF